MCAITDIACSLSPERMRSRTHLAAQLGASSLIDVATDSERAELTFASSAETQKRIEFFVASEKECCPFFDFTITPKQGVVSLTISAPEDGIALTRGLVAGFTSGWSLN